jgi:hypothetical protein
MCKSEEKIWPLHFTFNGVRGGFCIVFFVRETVGSSCIWVCLLNKCEISNIYCRAMTRVGIIEIIFNSDLKCLSVLSNVDRKYYQCIPKRGSRSDFKRPICTMNPRGDILEPQYLFFHFSIFLQAKFFKLIYLTF